MNSYWFKKILIKFYRIFLFPLFSISKYSEILGVLGDFTKQGLILGGILGGFKKGHILGDFRILGELTALNPYPQKNLPPEGVQILVL